MPFGQVKEGLRKARSPPAFIYVALTWSTGRQGTLSITSFRPLALRPRLPVRIAVITGNEVSKRHYFSMTSSHRTDSPEEVVLSPNVAKVSHGGIIPHGQRARKEEIDIPSTYKAFSVRAISSLQGAV